ncbi:hypothetical protein HU200_016297 [Digitaria exilis]|uniref:Uncharacterized protein n=1 Tax=Digitaria exilis TaxID=1010633 RepID=A0A835KJ75_9POAL|nr:hypothetical protein HU200_016297 [Digitaria exilis]
MDFYSDDSDPDLDEDLREDLDALRRSCILSGADPDAAVAQLSSSSASLAGPSTPALAAATTPAAADTDGFSSDDDDDEEEEDEDLALVRSIRENLHRLNNNKASPPPDAPSSSSSPRPICTWPPSDTDEDEDDLETLRAIQRRFSHYQSSTSTASPTTMKPEASQGVHTELSADGNDDVFASQKQNAKAPDRTGFPKAALLLVDALKKNRACQKLIRRRLINIEAKIEENKDLRDRVKCLLGYQLSCRKSAGRSLSQKEDPRVRLISSRKQTQLSEKTPTYEREICLVQNNNRKMPALSLGPAENRHVSKYKMALEQFPMSFKRQPWSDAEKDKLARGIKQQYQETLILDSLNNGSALGDFSAVDMAYALTNGAGSFEVTPESLRSVLPLINWDKISAMYLPGRSGAECESRYFFSSIFLFGHAWTKEEDLQLQAAVDTFGEKWQLVSASLDGRTGSQCSNRWRKTLHPTRTRVGRWDLDEDKRLMVSVKLIGSGSWSRIAPFIPGRTQPQCHERWKNILDPNIDLGEWRPEEDLKLLASVSEFGKCWSKIASIIPGRNDSMCFRRWKKLRDHEVPAVKAVTQLKKSVFQTNFVDREKERPAIAPKDLILLMQSKGDGTDENTRDGSRKQTKENLAVSNIVNSSTVPGSVSADTVSNTISRRSRKSTGQRSKKQDEQNVSVTDGLDNLSSGRSRSRKRKATTGRNAAVQKTMMVPITVGNEAVPIETGGAVSVHSEVGTNRTMDPVSAGEEGVVKKRTRRSKPADRNAAAQKRIRRGSIPVGNEVAPTELRSPVSANEFGTNRIVGPVSDGEEGVVKKRKRHLKPAGSDGAARKRRCSVSVDNDAGTDVMRDSVAGEEVVAKKRARRSKPVGNEGVAGKRKRGSVPVGDEGVVKKRADSVATENHGGVTKRKGAPPRRKSAEDNVANADPELGLPSGPSEERVADAGNMDKVRRKSTPRPKQINMSEGDADKHSTFTRLTNCLSYARMKGIDRNKR